MTDDQSGQGEARGARRIPVRVQADLREAGGGGNRFKVDMIDISATGFRFGSANIIRPGMRGFLALPGMQGMECVVAWERNWVYGARFSQPLHPSVCDHIAARFPG